MAIKRYTAVLILVLMQFAFASGMRVNAEDITTGDLNHYNVILCVDGSGSLYTFEDKKGTDENQMRFLAIEHFVATLSDSGNRLGCVVFGDGILAEEKLTAVHSRTDKETIINTIRGCAPSQYTDIGAGLLKSMNLMNEGADPDLPSIILLFSDGHTNTPNLDDSIKDREEAVELARAAGCKVYTVFLNANKDQNRSELDYISTSTGGECYEVEDPEDILDVYSLFREMIYGSSTQSIGSGQFDQNGLYSRTFNVPKIGISEVNISMTGKVAGFDLINASGYSYTEEEKAEMAWSNESFTLVKIPKAESGLWTVTARGAANTAISVDMVINGNIAITSRLDNTALKVGDTVTVHADLYSDGVKVSPEEFRDEFTAELLVTSPSSDTPVPYTMETDSTGFCMALPITEEGTYHFSVSTAGNGLRASAESMSVNINNTPPYLADETKEEKKHILVFPIIKTEFSYPLKGIVIDNEDGDPARYVIIRSAFGESCTEVDGVLKFMDMPVTKGAVDIRAYDSKGAYCDFTVTITSTNVGIVGSIVIVAAAVIIITVLAVKAWKIAGKSFGGKVIVTSMYSGRYTMDEGRGEKNLSGFEVTEEWIAPRKSRLQPGGKDYINFIPKCKGTVYVNGTSARSGKPVKIYGGGYPTVISRDAEASESITIEFIPTSGDGSDIYYGY